MDNHLASLGWYIKRLVRVAMTKMALPDHPHHAENCVYPVSIR